MLKKSKSFREWFNVLPEDIRKKMIVNVIKQHDEEYLDRAKAFDLRTAIAGSFVWRHTEEGHDYWSEIEQEYKNK